MPKAGDHHVLDRPLFTVGKLDFRSLCLLAIAGPHTAIRANADAGTLTTGFARLWRFLLTFARKLPALRTSLWLQWLAVPFWILKVLVGPNKVIDREIILAVIQPGPTSNDLLELDDRIDRPHQHDVANVASVNASGQFLRCGQDSWDRFLVVLKVSQMLLTKSTIVRCDTLAVIRISAVLHLVDQITNSQSVLLGGAKHQRLFPLVDLLQKHFHAVLFAFANLDDLIEVRLLISLADFNVTIHNRIVRCVNVFVQRRGDLP